MKILKKLNCQRSAMSSCESIKLFQSNFKQCFWTITQNLIATEDLRIKEKSAIVVKF